MFGAVPVTTCSITASGEYYLDQDLTCSQFTISADNVVFNLRGHTIYGSTGCTSCKIYMDGKTNVTVLNGSLKDMYVNIVRSDHIWIEYLNITTSASFPIYVGSSQYLFIHHNIIKGGGNTGIYLPVSSNAKLYKNVIYNLPYQGVRVSNGGHSNNITDNYIFWIYASTSSLQYGGVIVKDSGCTNNNIVGNYIVKNTQMGVWIFETPNTIHDNFVCDNQQDLNVGTAVVSYNNTCDTGTGCARPCPTNAPPAPRILSIEGQTSSPVFVPPTTTELSVRFTYTDSHDPVAICAILVNGTEQISDIVVFNDSAHTESLALAPSRYKIAVRCKDPRLGEATSAEWEVIFTDDKEAPEVQWEAPTPAGNSTVYQTWVGLNASSNTSDLSFINLSITGPVNDSHQCNASPCFHNFTNLTEGQYNLSAKACDKVGNCRVINRLVNISFGEINLTLHNPTEHYTPHSFILVNATATAVPSLSFINLSITGPVNDSHQCNASPCFHNFTNLSKGNYTVRALASNGLRVVVDQTWQLVDLAAPRIIRRNNVSLFDGPVIVNLSIDDFSLDWFAINITAVEYYTPADLNGTTPNYTFYKAYHLPDGDYTVKAWANDTLGRQTNLVYNVSVDTMPPALHLRSPSHSVCKNKCYVNVDMIDAHPKNISIHVWQNDTVVYERVCLSSSCTAEVVLPLGEYVLGVRGCDELGHCANTTKNLIFIKGTKEKSHKHIHAIYFDAPLKISVRANRTINVSLTIRNLGDYEERISFKPRCGPLDCSQPPDLSVPISGEAQAVLMLSAPNEGRYFVEICASYADKEWCRGIVVDAWQPRPPKKEEAKNQTVSTPECRANADCASNQICMAQECINLTCACGYAQNHQCVFYQCCADSQCPNGRCINHTCVFSTENISLRVLFNGQEIARLLEVTLNTGDHELIIKKNGQIIKRLLIHVNEKIIKSPAQESNPVLAGAVGFALGAGLGAFLHGFLTRRRR